MLFRSSGLLAAASIGSTIRGEVDEAEAAQFFEKCYRQAYLRFLVFLSAFYDVGRKKESYFWEAQRLTEDDAETKDLNGAFLKLVTGVKDMADAKTFATAKLVWNDYCGQTDPLAPYIGHIETLAHHINQAPTGLCTALLAKDRKSTRLNSSH